MTKVVSSKEWKGEGKTKRERMEGEVCEKLMGQGLEAYHSIFVKGTKE